MTRHTDTSALTGSTKILPPTSMNERAHLKQRQDLSAADILVGSYVICSIHQLHSAHWRSTNHKIVIRHEKQTTVHYPHSSCARLLATTKTEHQMECALLLDVIV